MDDTREVDSPEVVAILEERKKELEEQARMTPEQLRKQLRSALDAIQVVKAEKEFVCNDNHEVRSELILEKVHSTNQENIITGLRKQLERAGGDPDEEKQVIEAMDKDLENLCVLCGPGLSDIEKDAQDFSKRGQSKLMMDEMERNRIEDLGNISVAMLNLLKDEVKTLYTKKPEDDKATP